MSEDREGVAEELRRVRDEARRRARAGDGGDTEPTPATSNRPRVPPRGPREEAPVAMEPPPTSPDTAAVNATWRAEAPAGRGLSGRVRRLLERLLAPRLEAQQVFNSRQVQLDNEMLAFLEQRSAATHRHYDRLLGQLGRRLDEADERHEILERELVGHVQDLVRRIDLVLTDGSRGRLALEFAVEELRERLARLEKARRPK